MKYKVVVFDMDGTVLDTLQDLTDGVNYAMQKVKLKKHTISEVRGFVGNGIPKLIERSIYPVQDKAIFDSAYKYFTEYYSIHCHDKTKAYDGIVELIISLKNSGVKCAVASNKDDYAVKELCDIYFNGLFDFCVGRSDSVEKKPAPDMVNKALKVLGFTKKDSVYVGDSDVDFMTAKNSMLDFIGVSWGFKGREFLSSLGATTIVDKPSEIFDLII